MRVYAAERTASKQRKALMGLAGRLWQSVSISNLGYMHLIFTGPCPRLAYVREIVRLLPFLLEIIHGLPADRECTRWIVLAGS